MSIRGGLSLISEGIGRRYRGLCLRFPRMAKFFNLVHRRRRPLRGAFIVFTHSIGFVLSIQAVMQTRTEQGAVAWAFALNTIPVVAVPAWMVFGSNKVEAYQSAMRVGMDEVRPLADKLIKNLQVAAVDPDETISGSQSEILDRLQAIGSLPLMGGNSAKLLVDGKATYDAILAAIAGAEHYILVQFYIFRDDAAGTRIRDALVAKAREGVNVYLLLDNVGSMGLSEDFIQSMLREGMKVRYVMGVGGKSNRFQLNFRNHRKIVVVDGKRGFLGGLNVGDEYVGKDPELTPWRDTHMEWQGPIVKCLQVPFAEDWRWATSDLLDELDWEIRPEDVAGKVEALCLATGPADPFETCAMGFLTLINGARDRVWLATPYFVPDNKIVSALQMAAIRGVDVRVILPDLSDSQLVHMSSFSYLKELADAGVKFYRFQKGFLHQKVMLIDDSISAIGSANLDNRSFRLNFEVIGIVSDVAFNGEVSRMLEADLANSKPTGSKAITEQSFWFRFRVRLARMLAPIQ